MRVDRHKNKKFIRGFIFGFILAVIIVVAIFFVINKLTSIQKLVIVNNVTNVTVDSTKCCLLAKGICQVIVEPTQCTTGIIVNCSSIICNPMLA
jgi:ABC-type xylose transport system permease subunit